MSHLGAEMPLLLEKEDINGLEIRHLPGKLNPLADFVSRTHAPQPEPMPDELVGVRIREVVVPSSGPPFLLPPASLRPDLWVGGIEEVV